MQQTHVTKIPACAEGVTVCIGHKGEVHGTHSSSVGDECCICSVRNCLFTVFVLASRRFYKHKLQGLSEAFIKHTMQADILQHGLCGP
jgi:hypothetical protein